MKKLVYMLLLVFAGTMAHAQVKIGANAKTIGSASNLEVEAANGSKTIIDKGTGAVTINAATTIKDGTEGAGKVWTSDAGGTGSWVSGAKISTIKGTAPNPWPSLIASAWVKTASITLGTGKWLVFFNATYSNPTSSNLSILWDVTTTATGYNQSPVIGRVVSGVGVPGLFAPVSAIYEVDATTATTYYVWAYSTVTGPTYSGEGRIFAIPVN